jgi:hypothetical protein
MVIKDQCLEAADYGRGRLAQIHRHKPDLVALNFDSFVKLALDNWMQKHSRCTQGHQII